MKTGLLVGKFAPLHKGHQFIIDLALHEVEELIIMIYDSSDVTNIPLNIRADWFNHLYNGHCRSEHPSMTIIEAWDGPPDTGTPKAAKLQEDYILKTLKRRKIDAFYSSEFYGEHMSKTLQAVDRRVDIDRVKWPISATKIRNNPYFNRKYLDPYVYKDFVTNVVFLGAPSTGKTTLAEAIAKKHKTTWMPEYGREYWEKHQVDRRLTPEQLVELAEGHLRREDRQLYSAYKYLFTDSNALTTYIFSMYYYNAVHDQLKVLADECQKRYDLVFVCDTDIPYDDTWDRSGNGNRQIMQKMIIADLIWRKIPFHIVNGSVEERIKQVDQVLLGHKKFLGKQDG
jgi:NadR type nicotinamide-nucleotide adenylyltransferase